MSKVDIESNARTQARTYVRARTYTYARTHTHARPHTRTQTHIHTREHTHTHWHAHAHTPARTNTITHARTQTNVCDKAFGHDAPTYHIFHNNRGNSETPIASLIFVWHSTCNTRPPIRCRLWKLFNCPFQTFLLHFTPNINFRRRRNRLCIPFAIFC